MADLQVIVEPIEETFSLKARIYEALKAAIMKMNIYDRDADLRLDERTISEQFGISRTPPDRIREVLLPRARSAGRRASKAASTSAMSAPPSPSRGT